MIEAISRQPSEMIELRNGRQELRVDSNFAAAFRGVTDESQASGGSANNTAAPVSTLQKAVPAATTSAATESTAATQSTGTSYPAGWNGPPNQPGSSYNPVLAWGQVQGQQPSWITGNYPGADWTATNDAGFLMPYSSLTAGPGEDMLSGANANVVNQDWAKYYTQADGTQMANQIMWGANNPTHEVPAPWLNSSNLDPQFTVSDPTNPNQPTQPNYVPVSQMPT